MSEQDTREKLEAELRDELRLVFGGNGGQRYASYKFVQSLLDRQDAITQREFAKAQEESTLEVMRADAKLRKEITELIADLETYRKYAEQGECEKPQSEENGDTREQLEADILAHYKTPEEKLLTVRKWLDRQAAITERRMAKDYEEQAEQLVNDMNAARAERDELQEAIDAMGNGQLYAMYRKACEERDHFKDLVRKQSESNH